MKRIYQPIMFFYVTLFLFSCENKPVKKDKAPDITQLQIEKLAHGKKINPNDKLSIINSVLKDSLVLSLVRNDKNDTLFICKNEWISDLKGVKLPFNKKGAVLLVDKKYDVLEGTAKVLVNYRYKNQTLSKYALVLDISKIVWTNELVAVQLDYRFGSNTFVLSWGPAWQILYVTPSYFT